MHQKFDQAKDWVSIMDLTVGVGALKCLLVLGVRLSHLKKDHNNNFTLSHNHVQVLGLYITENSTGEFVLESLGEVEKKTGNSFAAILCDQGPDVKKGANQYKENSKQTVVVHDISHKLANLLEKTLKNDPYWKQFCEHLTDTKQSVQQTRDLAALMPPKLRSKARYMSVDILMYWVKRFRESKESGYMESISQDRFDKYFGWLEPLESHIKRWEQVVAIGEIIKNIIRVNGYSHKTYQKLEEILGSKYEGAPASVINFIDAAMNMVWEEVEGFKPRQTTIGDGRIIESIFGKFKQSPSNQLHGVTISALGIATFMANNEFDEVKRSMEATTIKQVMKWGEKCIKNSLTSLRRKFFPHTKRNKNGENLKEEAHP